MKRFPAIAVLLLAAAPAFSQKPAVVSTPHIDSALLLVYNSAIRQQPEPMPNAMVVRPLPEAYLGNNGKGLNLYKSLIDGMPIAKPDGSFLDSMSKQLLQKKITPWRPPFSH
jgi:hypothetical protein